MEFLSNQLGFHHPEEIEFQCIHRIGKKGDRPRMIIARFLRFGDRISQIVYVLSSLPTPKGLIKEINALLYGFLWGNKGDKIKRTEMINYSNGGEGGGGGEK